MMWGFKFGIGESDSVDRKFGYTSGVSDGQQ